MTQGSWDFENGGNSGGSDKKKVHFTKFPEGITRIRTVDEAPYHRWTHWLQRYGRSVTCPGRGCPICAIRKQEKESGVSQTYNIQRKLSMHIINRETGQVEVIDQGINFFEDLKILRADAQKMSAELTDFDLKIRRRGLTSENTSYRIDFEDDSPNPLTPKEVELVEEHRINFADYYKPHTPEQIKRLMTGNEKWEDVVTSDSTSNQQQNNSDEHIEIK